MSGTYEEKQKITYVARETKNIRDLPVTVKSEYRLT